jgi:hypothetical protein
MRSPSPRSTTEQSKGTKRNYQPAHGRDFEIVMRAADDYETSRTRDGIAYLVLGAVAIAMLMAVAHGLQSGNFGATKDVWTVAGPITGAIVGYYFHRGRKASE